MSSANSSQPRSNAPSLGEPDLVWLVLCRDIPNSAHLRRRHLAQHLAYIESVMDRVSVAGPLSANLAGSFSGSCFIYRASDLEDAEALLHNDPYYQAGLYETVEIHAFRPAAGVWIGGATW